MTRVKRIMFSLAASLGLLLPMAVPSMVSAASITEGLQKGTCLSTTDSSCDETGDADTKVNSLITNVINIFSLAVGIISVIMIIIGGLKYITSGGDSGNVTGAKNTILYAVVGLIIVALAQVIVRYVLDKATA